MRILEIQNAHLICSSTTTEKFVKGNFIICNANVNITHLKRTIHQFRFTFDFILGWRFILLRGQLCDKGLEAGAINHTADNITGKGV